MGKKVKAVKVKSVAKKNTTFTTAAVIDVGSGALRLDIAESSKNKVHLLESLRYPLSLGHDTFTLGKISFDRCDKTCEIVNKFLAVIEEYNVEHIRAVATTAVREASNRDYFIEQIRTKTGLSLDVLDENDEKTFIYKEMSRIISQSAKFDGAGLMLYIGAGNIGVSVYDNGVVPFTQNIRIGSLRITEILGGVQEYTDDFYTVLEEYIISFTDILNSILPKTELKHFFVTGMDVDLIGDLCRADKDKQFLYISKSKFMELFNSIKNKTTTQIMDEFDILEERAEVILPALALYKTMLDFTLADTIIAPLMFLKDALLYEMLYPKSTVLNNKLFEQNSVLSATSIAERFSYDVEHCRRIVSFSLKIFDKIRKPQGLNPRGRLLLHCAAILHDVGKFINVHKHYEHSYHIINASDIVGLNLREIELVALIARYHSRLTPSPNDAPYRILSDADRVTVSKLAAILRIADSLDRSHEQKFDDIDVKIIERELVVVLSTYKNTKIEEWSFAEKCELFKEVYGMNAYIKKKKVF